MMQPHVLLVTIDSLRVDHVSCCASDAPVETPRIDAIGERGTVFTDAVAQGPFTTFSMPSLFTSRYPTGLDYVEFSEDVVGVYIDDTPTVTECLREASYATAGFHSNPLLSNLFNFDRGFDAFDADLPFADFDLPGRLKLMTNKIRRLLRRHPYVTAATLTNRALGWVERHDDAPFFLWTHYMDVHGPYQRKAGFTYYNKFRGERLWQKAVRSPDAITATEGAELNAAYREEVGYTDEHVGRLVSGVRAESDRPVLVVVTADHGDALGERDYYGHPHLVHDELIRVPLIVDDPTGTVGQGRVDRPTELIDIAPTVLAAVDTDVPEDFEGGTLGGSTATESPAISEAELAPAYRAAFLTDRWKYVLDDVDGEERLFDRQRDDAADVSDEFTDEFDDLRRLALTHRSRAAATSRVATDEAITDTETRDRLRRLGYLE